MSWDLGEFDGFKERVVWREYGCLLREKCIIMLGERIVEVLSD